MQQKKRSKRLLYYAIAAIAVIGLVLFMKYRSAGDNKPIIRNAKVEVGNVTASVSANGVLQPLTTVQVKSNVGGQVVKLAVDEGDTVKAGQLIAKIDPSDSLTAYEQSQSDLAAATSKVDQSRQQLAMQHAQDNAQIEASKQALAGAKAKLLQAQEQAQVQPTLTTSAINQAKSSLVAAQASLKQTKTALVPQKLSSAQSGYNQAKANMITAENDLKRQKDLLAKGFVSTSQVEAAQQKNDVAKAQLDDAKRVFDTVKDETDQDLSTAQAKVDQAQASLDNAMANSVQDKLKRQDLVAAQASVRQAQANLDNANASLYQDSIRKGDIVQANAQVTRSNAAMKNAQTTLGYTTIVAPRSGIVTAKYVEEGSIVTAGRSSFSGSGTGVGLVDIADISRMFALVSVDETDIAQIELGQEVYITVEAYPDEPFTGKVTKIAPQSVVNQNVTTIPVTVEVELPDQRLKPGMNVTCDFITGKAENVLMVPNEAINLVDPESKVSQNQEETTVLVLEKGKRVPRKVETGIVGTDYTEIKTGLKQGEVIVTAIIIPTSAALSQGAGGGGARPPGGPGGFGGGMRH